MPFSIHIHNPKLSVISDLLLPRRRGCTKPNETTTYPSPPLQGTESQSFRIQPHRRLQESRSQERDRVLRTGTLFSRIPNTRFSNITKFLYEGLGARLTTLFYISKEKAKTTIFSPTFLTLSLSETREATSISIPKHPNMQVARQPRNMCSRYGNPPPPKLLDIRIALEDHSWYSTSPLLQKKQAIPIPFRVPTHVSWQSL